MDGFSILYEDVDEIRSHGQTIVYTIHETTGHLGIFVSGSVARKEHGEFSSNIDLIDVLPPGLYEAVFEAKTSDTVRIRFRHRRLGHAVRSQERSTIFALSAATMQPMNVGSRPRLGFPK